MAEGLTAEGFKRKQQQVS